MMSGMADVERLEAVVMQKRREAAYWKAVAARYARHQDDCDVVIWNQLGPAPFAESCACGYAGALRIDPANEVSPEAKPTPPGSPDEQERR